MIPVITAVAFALPVYAQGPPVNEPKSESDLGVEWTDTLEAVRAKYPDGEGATAGNIGEWKIRNSRQIFDIDRREQDFIAFKFFGPTLGAVTISFPDCDSLAAALATQVKRWPESLRGFMGPVRLGTWNGRDVMAAALETRDGCLMNMGLD